MITLEYKNTVEFSTHGIQLKTGDKITLPEKEANTLKDTFKDWFIVVSEPKVETKTTEEPKKASKK